MPLQVSDFLTDCGLFELIVLETGWSRYDTDVENSERDVALATKHLMDNIIPALARDLDQIDISDFITRIEIQVHSPRK